MYVDVFAIAGAALSIYLGVVYDVNPLFIVSLVLFHLLAFKVKVGA